MICSFRKGSFFMDFKSHFFTGKKPSEQFTLIRWIPFYYYSYYDLLCMLYFLGGLAGASGINGVIALWMPVENYDDSLLNNFRFFLVMTMILNIFVSLTMSKGNY